MGNIDLRLGDCLEVLKSVKDDSIDSLLTDPPAGIGFMGKSWDSNKGGRDSWINWMSEVMSECFRVLKPGAHGLVWAIPRTSHWTATALENAGFEVRDVVTHLFGSGFPKSMNVSKAIDKAAGAERTSDYIPNLTNQTFGAGKCKAAGVDRTPGVNLSGLPVTPEAKQWDGWGTALKPASEHWILIRKPLSEKTVAKNVLKWGTGAINVDGCRVASEENRPTGLKKDGSRSQKVGNDGWDRPWKNDERANRVVGDGSPVTSQGRFPANLVLSHTIFCDDECSDDCPVRLLNEQSGNCPSATNKKATKSGGIWGVGAIPQFENGAPYSGESGGASRFFYVAKASKRERNEGLGELTEKPVHRLGAGIGQGRDPNAPSLDKNTHPTVKPQKLMQYLARMITPPGGVVLDPFMGSGSTGVAVKGEGFGFTGIEAEAEYFEICKARIKP